MEMTKMLLPAISSVEKIHRNKPLPNVYCDMDYAAANLEKRILLKLLQQNNLFLVRDKCRPSLKTKLTSNCLQRNACPSANEDARHKNNDAKTTASTEDKTKAHFSHRPLVSHPKPAPESKSEWRYKSGPEVKLESKLELRSEPVLKSNAELIDLKSEIVTKPELKPEPKPELSSEQRFWSMLDPITELAELEWKQELFNRKLHYHNEIEDNNIEENNDICFLTSEFYNINSTSDSEEDKLRSEAEKQKLDRSEKDNIIFASKYRKYKKNQFFNNISSNSRMLSSTISYTSNINENDMFYRRLQYSAQTNLVNRSLLRSQQNATSSVNQQTNHQEKDENRKIEIKKILNEIIEQQIMTGEINESKKSSEKLHQVSNKSLLKNKNYTTRYTKRSLRRNRGQNIPQQDTRQEISRNTLNDHCYHMNKPENIEPLRIKKENQSTEEEVIDVVSLTKSDSEEEQDSNEDSEEEEDHQSNKVLIQTQQNRTAAHPVRNARDISTTVEIKRPRGRPPKRKRIEEISQSTSKRIRIQTNEQTTKQQNEIEVKDDIDHKRHIHNSMERMRRINMKENFNHLRDCIPKLARNEKVSKVSILDAAKTYITFCEQLRTDLEQERDSLLKRHKNLENRKRILAKKGLI